ncbi:MAG: chemotaxis protein CheD [Armatimonadetes bacterium]|nr:chemotaxis protein CheD [Armatimonadota bacterium]
MVHTVGISEFQVSNRWDDVIVTYSLGSCIGVTVFDPVARVGGMVHCLLPLSQLDPAKAQQRPAMFADTGIAMLLTSVYELGAQRDRLIAKLAGSAHMLDESGTFRIGERNHLVATKMLQKNGIRVAKEDVGGSIARTLYLHLDGGRTMIRSRGQEWEL